MPHGTGVSSGIGVAQAMIWQVPVAYDYIPRKSNQADREYARFQTARDALLEKTLQLRDKTARQFGEAEAAIFDAYHMMLNDEEGLLRPLHNKMLLDRLSAEYAVTTQFDELARQFLSLDDDYMRQRVDDVFSLRDQLMRELLGHQGQDASHLDRPTIVVAHALSPADIAGLDLSRLEGVVCEAGGYTSHLSIICRTLNIPAVVGAVDIASQVRSGELIALDGETGEIWIEPDENDIRRLRRRADALAERRAEAQVYRGRPTISVDGRRVELSASIGQLEEVNQALSADAESIGLFRTELLHLAFSGLPGEEEQFELYRAMLDKLNGKAAAVRTFDDGGNKPSLSIKNRREDNPVLGYRGIRMSLGRPSFFRTQLRALLRASAYGSLKILFPMISSIDELDEALAALEQVKAELRREGLPFDEKLPIGAIIEVPAAALLSEIIAQKVAFLSIGINDLIQFTLAIDRGNPDLSYLYHQYHPAVLRLVRWTVNAAHAANIPCTLCGEAPGQDKVLPLLLGLGLDGFSMNPTLILQARQILNSCSYAECRQAADEILQLHSTAEVARRLSAMF